MLSISPNVGDDFVEEDDNLDNAWSTQTIMGLRAGKSTWRAADDGEETTAGHSHEPVEFDGNDRQSDEMLARYLGDVRRFALLSPAEERALWQRVTDWQTRLCRALYLSPIALPTLMALWRQLQRGEVPLQDILESPQPESNDSDWDTDRLGTHVTRLRAHSTRLRRLSNQRRRCSSASVAERREMRQRYRHLRGEWLALWHDIPLTPEVHDMMLQALQAAMSKQPTCPALRAAYGAATHAQRELEQAKSQMILANLRLVIYMAKRHHSTHLSFLDLIQEGNAGLMRAMERFDPERGVKFATYACWWIRQTISRALINQNETIRIPNHVVERKNKLNAMMTTLRQRYQRSPTDQELSQALSWPIHVVQQTKQERHAIRWLHESVDDDSLRRIDMVQDDQLRPPDEEIARLQLQQSIVDSLDTLPKREAQILRLRFGLETDRAYTLQEIGEQMGLSRERIRQIEKAALKKLRFSAAGDSLAEIAGIAAS